MMKKFQWLTGDVNYREYGGKWYRQDDKDLYTVIEMTNMEEACGDISNGRYLATVQEITTDDPGTNAAAMDFAGMTESDVKEYPLLLVEALSSYGGDEMWSDFSNNFYELLAEAKRSW